MNLKRLNLPLIAKLRKINLESFSAESLTLYVLTGVESAVLLI